VIVCGRPSAECTIVVCVYHCCLRVPLLSACTIVVCVYHCCLRVPLLLTAGLFASYCYPFGFVGVCLGLLGLFVNRFSFDM